MNSVDKYIKNLNIRFPHILYRQEQEHNNEIALVNKQCKHLYEQLKNIDEQANEAKKVGAVMFFFNF